MKAILSILIVIILFAFQENQPNNIQVDKGKLLANKCINCHVKSSNHLDSGLTNIRKTRTFDWIYNFTTNPLKFSKRNLEAKKIIDKYKPLVMVSFPALTKNELKLILDFYDRK